MRVIDENRFRLLVEQGLIRQQNCAFLDGIKIGLAIEPKGLVARSPVSAKQPPESSHAFEETTFDAITLKPDHFYLAKTVQALSIPPNVFGLLHTNSKWARIGLDCLGSSSYVSPGFGDNQPTSLVLEIRVTVPVNDFSNSLSHLAGMILFELDGPVRVGAANHRERFPLSVL